MLDILMKEYRNLDELINDLQLNFYPECSIVEYPKWNKGIHEYTWEGNLVFSYFNSLYLVNISARGNGGWLGIDECNVISIKPVKHLTHDIIEVKKYIV